MTLPTKLSLLRILLTFVTMALLFMPLAAGKIAALACFGVASATDWLDGYLARKRGLVSTFGKLMDALTDKIMVVGLVVAFVNMDEIPVSARACT